MTKKVGLIRNLKLTEVLVSVGKRDVEDVAAIVWNVEAKAIRSVGGRRLRVARVDGDDFDRNLSDVVSEHHIEVVATNGGFNR